MAVGICGTDREIAEGAYGNQTAVQPLTPPPARWVSPDYIRCFGVRGQCSRGDDSWVPCHPRQVMTLAQLADTLAVCVNQQINRAQPCSAAGIRDRLLGPGGTTLRAELGDCEVTACPGIMTLRDGCQISPFGPGQRITGVRLEVIDMRLLAHHFRSGSAH
jgi:hypothetical protein